MFVWEKSKEKKQQLLDVGRMEGLDQLFYKKVYKKGKIGNECWIYGRGENDYVEKGRCYRIFVKFCCFLY